MFRKDLLICKARMLFDEFGAPVLAQVDKGRIGSSRKVGSTGVFDRRVNGQPLVFYYKDSFFYDEQTKSLWDITGQAIQGPLQGKKLMRVVHGDYFAFAWLAFKPETEICR